MKLTLTIPDDDYEALAFDAKASKSTPEKLLLTRSAVFSGLPSTTRVVLLHGTALHELEQLLGALGTGDDVLSRVERLSGLSLGSYKLELSPAQLLAAKARAGKMGMTFEAYLKDVETRVGRYMEQEI